MDFSELRQMGEELISLGNQQVNENDDKNLDATNNNTEDVSFSNLQSSSPQNNNSSFTFPTSYRNVESSIASTSYSSAIDDPLASAVTHNQNTSQHTYFNASELLGINSLYKNQLGLGNAEFTSPSPVMEDIEEGDEGVTEKHFDDPVLHFHDPGRGVDNNSKHTTSSSTSSVMKDIQVAQLLQQQLDGWNFQDDKQNSSDWNMNIHGLQELDTQTDFQQTFMNGNMLKQADQRENFDTSSLYFSTYGSDYAPSMDNLETQQFFPNPHQPLVSISGSGATTSVSSSAKVLTEKRFHPTKHRVARKELRSLPAKLAKAKKKKQQQQQQQRLFQNQTTIPTTTTSTCTTSNIIHMPNLSSGNKRSITSTFTRPISASVSSVRSYSTQSTSQQSYNKTISPPPPILDNQNPTEQQELIQPSDMPETTRLIYAAFAQTKFVYYDSADDKRAKRSSVPDGFAGFACKHCEGKSKCAEGNNSSRKKPKFARCGRYFPSNIKTFADRSKTLNALVKHLGKCPLVPLQTRNNLILFEQSHDEETKMKRLLNANYTQKEIFKVMWNRLHPGDEE